MPDERLDCAGAGRPWRMSSAPLSVGPGGIQTSATRYPLGSGSAVWSSSRTASRSALQRAARCGPSCSLEPTVSTPDCAPFDRCRVVVEGSLQLWSGNPDASGADPAGLMGRAWRRWHGRTAPPGRRHCHDAHLPIRLRPTDRALRGRAGLDRRPAPPRPRRSQPGATRRGRPGRIAASEPAGRARARRWPRTAA